MTTPWAENAEKVRVWHEQAVKSLPKSRGTASQILILDTFRSLAIKTGRMTLKDSYRELSIATGLSLPTLAKHLKRLSAWIEHVDQGKGKRSHWHIKACTTLVPNCATLVPSWTKVNIPIDLDSRYIDTYILDTTRDCTTFVHAEEERNPYLLPQHDFWHGRQTGRRVYLILCPTKGQTEEEVHEAIVPPVHPRTTRRWLNRLETEGLASLRDDHTWIRLAKPLGEKDESHDDDFKWHFQRKDRYKVDRTVYQEVPRGTEKAEEFLHAVEVDITLERFLKSDISGLL